MRSETIVNGHMRLTMDTLFPNNAYTIKSFCAAYGIGRTLTYAEISSGRLKAKKVGNRTLILKADADAWANSLPASKH